MWAIVGHMGKPKIPDRKTRARIAALANVDERTVHRYYLGQGRRQANNDAAICAAIKKLAGGA